MKKMTLWLAAALLLQGCKYDVTPEPFAFAGQSKVAPDTFAVSNTVTIKGISPSAPVYIHGGQFAIDGGAWQSGPAVIDNRQKIRVRVRSSAESSGEATATLTVGDVSASFTVTTVNFSGRVEAEDASLTGGASTVPDRAASRDLAVFVGSANLGISIAESLDAKALILSYRSNAAGTLRVTVNGADAGKFTLRATAEEYASASLVGEFQEGDVIAISAPADAGSSETYIDYVQFAASPFRWVSTVGGVDPWVSDGMSVGPDGNLYMSGGPPGVSGGTEIIRITPDGGMSTFAAGFASANGSDFDSQGNLYVADYDASAVRKITPEGVMSVFASGLDGPAGVWVDAEDHVFVTLFGANFSASGATVLRIAPDGNVSTYASGDGLQDVIGIVGDEQGRVYASNWASAQIFEITGGNVSPLAAVNAGNANHICYSDGYIYVPSPGGAVVSRVGLDGTVEHFIGTPERQTVDGPIAEADFLRPNDCDFFADGSILYVSDRESGLVRKVDAGRP